MRKQINRAFSLIKQISSKGFFEIVFSTTLVKALMFLSAMFLPRFLSVEDYALLTFSETVINYFLLISGLGLSAAVLKKCSENNMNEAKRKGYLLFSSILGIGFNVIVAFVYLFVGLTVTFKIPGSNSVVLFMLGLPFFAFLFQNIQYYLRAVLQNKKYSVLTILYTAMYVGLQIILTIVCGIKGTIAARYVAYIFCLFLGGILIRPMLQNKAEFPNNKEKREVVVFSLVILVGSFFSSAVLNNELLLIGSFFSNSYLSRFRVASYVLQICVFFVEAITIFAMPYFSKHSKDKQWVWINYKRMFFFNAVLMTLVAMALALGAELFVTMLWGKEYIDSVPIIRILLIAAWCQTVFRAIPGNILAFIGGEKFTFFINIITCVLHIVMDVFLFEYFGEAFAGFGLIFAYAFSGLCMMLKIRRICKNEN